jgi:NAD(P)H-dependent FMN reductase
MRILAISGSLRRGSTNTRILEEARRCAPFGVEVELFGGIAELPAFNPDLEALPQPAVAAWRAALRDAQAVLVSSPEYAHGVPGALKNALDWVVGSGELVEKPVGLISASGTGAEHAHAALLRTLAVMNARLIPDALVQVGAIRRKVAPDGAIADEGLRADIARVVRALAQRPDDGGHRDPERR